MANTTDKPLKLMSWNVNGIRACMNKGFMDFFEKESPDILCLQESKLSPETPKPEFPGYYTYWNLAEKKGYSGTVIVSRYQPSSVSYGIGIAQHDNEGRVITATFQDFYLVCVYTPNSQRGLLRLDYRMVWEDAFRDYLMKLDREKPVILCGDLNVAHKEIDIKNAAANVKNAGFTPEERAKMTVLLDSGFIDSFRTLYPTTEDAYTWWSYMGKARERNVGWRIDYFLLSERLKSALLEAAILPEVTGSDHCPVEVTMALKP